jgi:hypothetical protein
VKRVAALTLLLLAAPTWASDPPAAAPPVVTLPAARKVAVGERFSLAPVVTNGGVPKWYAPDPGLREDRTFLDLIPDELATKLKGRVFYAEAAGTYRICVYVGGDNRTASDVTICTVTAGDVPPAPPGPGPTPPGPTPGDPLATTLAATYKADGAPAAQAKALVSLYRLGSTSTVNDPALTTLDALVAVMHKAADSLLPPPAAGPRPLAATRDAIKADLAAKVGTKPGTPLDAALRKTLADQFARYAALLDSLSK